MQRATSSSEDNETRPCLHFRKVQGARLVPLGRPSCHVDIESNKHNDVTTFELTWQHLSPGVDTSTCTCDLRVEESYQASDVSSDLCFPVVRAIESDNFIDLRDFAKVLFEEYDCRLTRVQVSPVETSKCRITLLIEHGSDRSVDYTRKNLQKFKDTVLKPSIHKWTQTLPVRKELHVQFLLPDITSDQQREGRFSSLPTRIPSSGDSGLAASTSSLSREASTSTLPPRLRSSRRPPRQRESEPRDDDGLRSLPNLSDLTLDPLDGAAMAPPSKNLHHSSVLEFSSSDEVTDDRWKDKEAEQTMKKMSVTLPHADLQSQSPPAGSLSSPGGATAAEPATEKSDQSSEDPGDDPIPSRVIVQETETSSPQLPTFSFDYSDNERFGVFLARLSAQDRQELRRNYPGAFPSEDNSPTRDDSQPVSGSLSVDAPVSGEATNKPLSLLSQTLSEDSQRHEETGTPSQASGGEVQEHSGLASGDVDDPRETLTERISGDLSATSSEQASDAQQAAAGLTSEPARDSSEENSADGSGRQNTHPAATGAVAKPHTSATTHTTEVRRGTSIVGPSQSTDVPSSVSFPSHQTQAVHTEVKQQATSLSTAPESPQGDPQQEPEQKTQQEPEQKTQQGLEQGPQQGPDQKPQQGPDQKPQVGPEQGLQQESRPLLSGSLHEPRPEAVGQSPGVGADSGLPSQTSAEAEARSLPLSREGLDAVSDIASEAAHSSGARSKRTTATSVVPSTASAAPRRRRLCFSMTLPTDSRGGQERQRTATPRKKTRRRKDPEREKAYAALENQLISMQQLLEGQASEDAERVRKLNEMLELLIKEFFAERSPKRQDAGEDTAARIAQLTEGFFASTVQSAASGQQDLHGLAAGQTGHTQVSPDRTLDTRSDVTTTGQADVTTRHNNAPGASAAVTSSRQQGDVIRQQTLPVTHTGQTVGQAGTPQHSAAPPQTGSAPSQQPSQHGDVTQPQQTSESQGSGESAGSQYAMSEMQLVAEGVSPAVPMHGQRSQDSVPSKTQDSASLKKHTSRDQDIDPLARRLLNKVNVSESDALLRAVTRALREEQASPRSVSMQTILCLDCSPSMRQEGLQSVKEAALDFLDGIEEEAENCGLEENIAVVTFGESTEVTQHLTVDYQAVRTAIENISLGGRSPLFEGLLVCLAAVGDRGGTLRIGHTHSVHPRIIVFTDGKASGGESDSGPENYDATPTHMRIALIQLINELNDTEHSSTVRPILWVPCGDADKKFLTSLSQLGEGKYVEPSNIREHCSYYRFHDYLAKVMMVAKTSDGKVDEDMLKVYVDGVVTGMDDVEKAKLVTAVRQKMEDKGKEPVDPTDFSTVVEREGLPPVGSRVVRGPHWCYDDQDKQGPGTIIAHDDKDEWVWVMWDHGDYNRYCYDQSKSKHIQLTDSQRLVKEGEPPAIGVQVVRGVDWNFGDQDGGEGSVGVVIRVKDSGKVKVKWSNGSILNYRYGRNNRFEVKPAKYDQSSPTKQSEAKEETDGKKSSQAAPGMTPGVSPGGAQKAGLWQWREGVGDLWHDYDPEVASRLEKAYQGNPRSTCLIYRAGQNRRVLFKSMRERDQGQKEIEVRRKVLDDVST